MTEQPEALTTKAKRLACTHEIVEVRQFKFWCVACKQFVRFISDLQVDAMRVET